MDSAFKPRHDALTEDQQLVASGIATDPIGVVITDESTGEKMTPEDIARKMAQLDTAEVVAGMRRAATNAMLPYSLFFKGSEFRRFVDDFTVEHGTPPLQFEVAGRAMPIPRYWPEDPIWTVVPQNWVRDFFVRHDSEDFRATYPVAAYFLDDTRIKVAGKRDRV